MAASAAASAAGKAQAPSADRPAAASDAAAAAAAAAGGDPSMEEVMKGGEMKGTAAAEEMDKLDRAALERFGYSQRLFFNSPRRMLLRSKQRACPVGAIDQEG